MSASSGFELRVLNSDWQYCIPTLMLTKQLYTGVGEVCARGRLSKWVRVVFIASHNASIHHPETAHFNKNIYCAL